MANVILYRVISGCPEAVAVCPSSVVAAEIAAVWPGEAWQIVPVADLARELQEEEEVSHGDRS